LGGGILVHNMKKNTETLTVASKEFGLEENIEDTKYIVMPWYKENHNMNVGNKPFERWNT